MHSLPSGRRGGPVRAGGLALACLFVLSACFGGIEPYKPRRPSPDYRGPVVLFPERTLLEPRDETPAETLSRIEAVFREIARVEDPEATGFRDELVAELDSVQASIEALDLGAGSVMRLRLGTPDQDERAEFRRAAALYTRWSLCRMRLGTADDRVRGAKLLERAREFDPADPVLATVQTVYLDMAGFRSNALRVLDQFELEHGPNDLVELTRFRKNLRQWTLLGHDEFAEDARAIGARLVERAGGWNESPSWLLYEMARMRFLADSLHAAEDLALRIIEREGAASSDPASAARAYLLLGLVETRRIEHTRAASHFARARHLAQSLESLEELSLVLDYPWDLWSDEEKAEFDRSLAQRDWVDRFWQINDPVWATPRVWENQVDYFARVAESTIRFDDIDLRHAGPATEPGRAVLRFGWPNRWERLGARSLVEGDTDVTFDFSVFLTWRFGYEWLPGGGLDRSIVFVDRSSARGYFVAQDSLRPPEWPDHRFDAGFLGRAYPFDTGVARFRLPGGGTRIFVSMDTVLPNYAVRFPFQGLRYEGEASVQSVLYRETAPEAWSPLREATTVLSREQVIQREREFRRRSGRLVYDAADAGRYRLPAFLRLRDADGRTLHVGIENDLLFEVPGFSSDDVTASDLLITSELAGIVQEDVSRELAPGWSVYGPDPDAFEIWPRASRKFLVGEELAYYLELYNLAQRQGVATVELEISLQKLDAEGELEYAVYLGESKDVLIKFGIRQWNVARSLGLGELEPGSYRLSIEAFDRIGRRKVLRTADFQVVSDQELMEHYLWPRLPAPPGNG